MEEEELLGKVEKVNTCLCFDSFFSSSLSWMMDLVP